MNNNIIVAVSGQDLLGKSTVCEKIRRYLVKKGEKVLLTSRPDKKSKFGLVLYNEAKKDKYENTMARYMLFAANNTLNFENKVLPWMKKNPAGIVIFDRFLLSALAYNIIETDLNIGVQSILDIEDLCCKQNYPHICFFLFSGSKNFDPYNSLKNRKDKLESNDLRDDKFKLKLSEKYEKAIKLYHSQTQGMNKVKRINIDDPEFMEEIFWEINNLV